MWHFIVEENKCFFSGISCVILTISYVGSLYIWKSKLHRDHPNTIKKRFFSVTCMMLIAPFFTYALVREELLQNGDLHDYMGLRISGMLTASIIPLLLTATLFLGPLTMHYFAGTWTPYRNPFRWFYNWTNMVWLRNHIMAPLSEEWVFRSCMMPLLMQCFEPLTAMFTGPLLFGIAHFHHVYEQMSSGRSFKLAFSISAFQFSFTTVFGVYSSFLFLRSGHFFAPLVAHIFCNHLGFPSITGAWEFPILPRIVILSNFVLGLVSWCYLLGPLTEPYIYDNKLQLLAEVDVRKLFEQFV